MMYHSRKHNILYKSSYPPECQGKAFEVNVRVDGKMPCVCGEEGHARFNWLMVSRMCELETHPSAGDKTWADILPQVPVPLPSNLKVALPPELSLPRLPSSDKETKPISDLPTEENLMEVDSGFERYVYSSGKAFSHL